MSGFSIKEGRHSVKPVGLTATAATSSPSCGKARLARALESTSRWVIKNILFSQCSSLAVRIDAKSNKSLIMGKFENVSISARHCRCRFNLVQFTRFDVVGTKLHLGFVPLLIPFLPLLIWKFRRYIWGTILCGMFLKFLAGHFEETSQQVINLLARGKKRVWHILGAQPFSDPAVEASNKAAIDSILRFSQQTQTSAKQIIDALQSGKRKVWQMLGTKPSTIDYSIAICNQDANDSLFAKLWLQNILRSLVQNSLIGAAAALGDAQDAVQSRLEDDYRERRLKRWRQTSNTRLLPFSGGSNNDGGALTSARTRSKQQGLVNSALLSATSFDLKETCLVDGRLVLSAEAILNEENGIKILPFTIRTKLEPVAVDYTYKIGSDGGVKQSLRQRMDHYNALGFANPECRLNTSPLTAGTLLGRFVPDIVWIPFGLGVVVPFGKHNLIRRADVQEDKAVPGTEVFKLDGAISIFAAHETKNAASPIVLSK